MKSLRKKLENTRKQLKSLTTYVENTQNKKLKNKKYKTKMINLFIKNRIYNKKQLIEREILKSFKEKRKDYKLLLIT